MTKNTPLSVEERALKIVPSPLQKQLQDMGFYFFIHFGMNTFTGREWGTGKESPATFCPDSIDTDQWARVAKEVGAGAIIFTAKHHEGFCLWQTDTTEHSIKNSPYQNGKGDVVKDLAISCKKYGIKLGFYLSPADRNSQYFATEKYNDYYCEQLTELLTRYGEIFCLWLDGADGGTKADGKYQDYDFERIFATAKKLQPNIILANGGPDVRWVGNEDAKTRDSEWCVVPSCLCPAILKKYHCNPPAPTAMDEDLGSRELLTNYDEYLWYPAEVDYSLHKGWFYHPLQMPRRLSVLYSAYMRTVGGNGLFLLNVPPNKKGRCARRDVLRLRSLKKKVDKTFSNLLCKQFTQTENNAFTMEIQPDSSVRTIVLREDTDYSQRVEEYRLLFYKGNRLVQTEKGTVIGFSRFISLKKPVQCDKVVLKADTFRGDKVYLRSFEIYG